MLGFRVIFDVSSFFSFFFVLFPCLLLFLRLRFISPFHHYVPSICGFSVPTVFHGHDGDAPPPAIAIITSPAVDILCGAGVGRVPETGPCPPIACPPLSEPFRSSSFRLALRTALQRENGALFSVGLFRQLTFTGSVSGSISSHFHCQPDSFHPVSEPLLSWLAIDRARGWHSIRHSH